MEYKEDEDGKDGKAKKEMLEWEKVNAIEYVRKDRIAELHTTDNRVVSTDDRLLQYIQWHRV